MGASRLTSRQLTQAAQIEAWAEEQAKLHSRECRERKCPGRRKMWWIVRHPMSSPEISNATAREVVIFRSHPCMLLCARLELKMIPYLPGEEEEHARRTPDDILRLLGYLPEPKEDEPREDIGNPFPEARAAMPQETKSGRNLREWRERRDRDAVRQRERMKPVTGLGSAVDALTRKG